MAVFIPQSSNDSSPAGLDLFSVPPNEVAIESRSFEDLRPISQFNGHMSPIQFEANIQGNVYTDLSKSFLFVKARVLKADGSVIQAGDTVSPINLWLHALFSRIDVYLNGTLVSSSGDLYPYKAFFKTFLRGGFNQPECKQRSSELLYKDTAGSLDVLDPNGANYGLYERNAFVKQSKLVDLSGCLLNDALELDRYLINGVTIRIVLSRARPEFCLMSNNVADGGGGYQVQIEEAMVRLVKLSINPAIIVAHGNLLKQSPAKYPFSKRIIKCANIPANQNFFVWDNIVTSTVPRFALVAFCDSDAVLGSYSKNPWNFKHYQLNNLTLTVNGVSAPSPPITADYNQGCYMQVYQRLLEFCQGTTKPRHLGIDRTDVAKGFALYIFNLQPQYNESPHFDLLRSGVLRVEAKFDAAMPETVCCLVYLEWSCGLIQIDEGRNVLLK